MDVSLVMKLLAQQISVVDNGDHIPSVKQESSRPPEH